MKKLLILLLLSTSFPALSEIDGREIWDLFYDYSLSEFCHYQPGIQNRGDDIWELYFPNEEKGITATSICVKKDSYNQIGLKGKLINGIQQGTWTSYYKNGQKNLEENYKDGILNGISTKWSRTGQKLEEKTLENGMPVGEMFKWFPSGQIKAKIVVNDSESNSLVTFWQLNGEKWIEVVIKNGKRIGECVLNEWDIQKTTVEMSLSSNDAEELQRYTEDIYQFHCKDH